MRIAVLVKHASSPESTLRVSADGKGVDPVCLTYDMNEWDRYAVEEAVRLKEKHGGEAVAVSVGVNCDATLRKCLAMGVDRAVKVPVEAGLDAVRVAEAIVGVLRGEPFDMVLSGFMSQDANNALVGVLVAAMLDIPFATAVTRLSVEGGEARAVRELEGGYLEEVFLPLPCLVTVQSGINEPRYISIFGVKAAKSKELREHTVRLGGATVAVERVYVPPARRAEILEGSPSEVAGKLVELISSRGVV
ncbi:MAG: electron transfer flavoprotein subunit beta/FixA family protein [Candidatus Freyarchaeota archaeon]|nr:electron transfer flavoprotein subunit beta/FixA family protein [Candidatus Jordarchaeia archaeon]